MPLGIERKEDSAEKLAAVAGKPTKNYLFAEEVNQIVQEVNNLEATINPDRIISLGTETIDGNEHTYEDYTWQLGGVQINNIGNPSIIVIPSATLGFKRKDISVFTPAGTIERVAGTETDGEVVTSPDVPEGTLYYKSYDIDGDTIGVDPEPPAIDGSIYKKKIENARWESTQSGTDVVIPFQAAGQMHYSVVNSELISVAGFSRTNLTGLLYEGIDVLFENQTGNPITLKNMFGGISNYVKFNFGADLVVPNGGKLWMRVRNREFELIMKSWSDIDLSTKADLVGGKVPPKQLPSYVDDVLEFANLAAFPVTGETGKIYVALDTNKTYRWSGSAYVQIGGGSERKYFETLGNRYMLGTINAFYSSMVENGLVSDNINAGVSTILTSSMATKWVTPLLITDKICKLKNFKFRASDTLSGFTQLRIIFFIGQSINGQVYRINNQVIHDEIITMSSGVNITFFERNTFTNDITIPKGYDLCYLISRLDGTGTNLYNVKISGYVD